MAFHMPGGQGPGEQASMFKSSKDQAGENRREKERDRRRRKNKDDDVRSPSRHPTFTKHGDWEFVIDGRVRSNNVSVEGRMTISSSRERYSLSGWFAPVNNGGNMEDVMRLVIGQRLSDASIQYEHRQPSDPDESVDPDDSPAPDPTGRTGSESVYPPTETSASTSQVGTSSFSGPSGAFSYAETSEGSSEAVAASSTAASVTTGASDAPQRFNGTFPHQKAGDVLAGSVQEAIHSRRNRHRAHYFASDISGDTAQWRKSIDGQVDDTRVLDASKQ
jgi:hypothetical protein